MKKIVFGITLLLLTVTGFSQNNVGTPYSKYGFGLLPDNYGAYTGVGGVSAAMRDNFNINFLNPASYTALDSVRFYFQAGYTGESVSISTYKAHGKYSVAQNAAVNMAFRVYKNLFASFGFNEKSNIGYDLYNLKNASGDAQTIYEEYIEGEGGLNEAYLGVGYQWGKLSLGVNAAYIFGKVEERLTVAPISYSFNYTLRTRTQNYINDVLFTLGAQYPIQLKKNSSLLLGGTFNFGTLLSGKKIYEAYTYDLNTQGAPEIINDERLDLGKVLYPLRFTAGASYYKGTRWMFSGDYTFHQMSKYKEYGDLVEDLNNYHKIAVGGSFQHSITSRNWFERNWYTAGAYFTRSHINLSERNINSCGVTLGTQIPFRSSEQFFLLGLAADLGFRGTKANGLMLEQYAKIRINLAFKERWFMKRKIY